MACDLKPCVNCQEFGCPMRRNCTAYLEWLMAHISEDELNDLERRFENGYYGLY